MAADASFREYFILQEEVLPLAFEAHQLCTLLAMPRSIFCYGLPQGDLPWVLTYDCGKDGHVLVTVLYGQLYLKVEQISTVEK